MATTAPADAALMPSWIFFQGAVFDPSLVPVNDASTNWVLASTGMSPQAPAPHEPTSWHVVSPGIASWPAGQGTVGPTTLHPRLPSDSKPLPHSEGGMPAGSQCPSDSRISPG